MDRTTMKYTMNYRIKTGACMAVLALLISLTALADDPCTCDAARLQNGWCESCKVGYVAGVKIPSPVLFEILDAHGHPVQFDNMKCQSCRVAYKSNGFCKRHRVGYVGQLAYFSRLTYYLAQGKSQERTRNTCKACRENSKTHGWCKVCSIGRVGNVTFKDEKIQAKAAKQYQRLLASIAKLADCEMCAAALFSSSRCPLCKISYKRGSKASQEQEAPKKKAPKKKAPKKSP